MIDNKLLLNYLMSYEDSDARAVVATRGQTDPSPGWKSKFTHMSALENFVDY